MFKRIVFFIAFAFVFVSMVASANTVARVIYAEAGPGCTAEEQVLVASVIKNRVGHVGFKSPSSMENVVTSKGQFTAFCDSGNPNWTATSWGKSPKNKAWDNACELAKGAFKASLGVVYFHDKSIDKPSNWDNKYWKTVLVKETQHFKFYAVVQNNKKVAKR